MRRYFELVVCVLALAIAPAAGQLPMYFPEVSASGGGSNVIPFGGASWVSGGYTFMQRIPAAELDPANPIIQEIALAPSGSGTWTANNVTIGLGHVPTPLPCPFSYPTPGGGLGSFIDFTTIWDSSTQGPFSWTATQDTWSDLGFAAQGGTGFMWDGTNDIAFFITFQSSNVNGWDGGCRGSRDIFGNPQAPYREYASGYNALVSTSNNCQELGLRMRLMVLCPTPQWQTNQPTSSLDIDGATNTPCNPLEVTRCVNIGASLNANSTLGGNPWDMGVSFGPPIPGLATTPGGQFINLNLADPSTFFFAGGTFANAFVPFSIPLSIPVPLDVSAQMIVLDPSNPTDPVALSALNWLHVVNGQPVLGPAFDDGYLEFFLGVPPLCGPASINFAGSSYSSLFVNSNGSVSFGSGEFWWGPSPQAFEARPFLAGMWSDLDPSSGGTVSTTAQAGIVTTSFQGVPEHGNPVLNSFDMTFDTNTGACGIYNYAPAPMLGAPFGSIVGLSPGVGAVDPGSITFSSLVGMGMQVGPGANAMVYEFTSSGAPFGFNSIEFPNSDGSMFIVN